MRLTRGSCALSIQRLRVQVPASPPFTIRSEKGAAPRCPPSFRMADTLLLKLVLTPVLIAAASLAGRRWGQDGWSACR